MDKRINIHVHTPHNLNPSAILSCCHLPWLIIVCRSQWVSCQNISVEKTRPRWNHIFGGSFCPSFAVSSKLLRCNMFRRIRGPLRGDKSSAGPPLNDRNGYVGRLHPYKWSDMGALLITDRCPPEKPQPISLSSCFRKVYQNLSNSQWKKGKKPTPKAKYKKGDMCSTHI